MKLLLARWIATMAELLIRDGGVVFDEEQILSVGPAAEMRRRFPRAEVHDAEGGVVLPGLVNAHTHLELTACARPERSATCATGSLPARERAGSAGTEDTGGQGASGTEAEDQAEACTPNEKTFAGWLRHVLMSRAQVGPDELAASVEQAVGAGVAQCLRFGVTTVGDISRQCQLTRPVLARSPLRVVSYGEVQALGQRRGLLEERLSAALDDSAATERLVIGLTPHAPYTVEPAAYARCLQVARERGLPLATHLAETLEENQFLAEHAGPLHELWNWLGWWDDQVPRFGGGPIRLAQSLGLLDHPTLLAHVNYCNDDELAILTAGKASVVYNPRTHAYFGHPPHRWREMLSRGINVAVGTDSCASSPDLNLVDELRLLRRRAPEVPTHTLWAMATIHGARALGLARSGVIAEGMRPDFTVFQVETDRPLDEILERLDSPRETWVAGVPVTPAAT